MRGLLKETEIRTCSHNERRGCVVSYETIYEKKLEVDSKILLPTVVGRFVFTVIKIEGDMATLESGSEMARMERIGKNRWRYNNITMNKNMKVRVTVVDELPPKPATNIGFSKTYK
jgi:hypothetical protein